MTAPRPTGYAGWASGPSGAAAITEPTATEKGLGWQVNQAAPSQYFNWLQALTYGWQAFLNDSLLGPGFSLRDDFTGDEIDRSKWQVSGSGITKATNDDATGLAFGAMQFIASNGDGTQRLLCPKLNVGTGSWRMEARARTPVFPTGHDGIMRVTVAGVPTGAGFLVSGNTFAGRWGLIFGSTLTDTGLRPSPSAYEDFLIERVGDRIFMSLAGPTGGGATGTVSLPSGANLNVLQPQVSLLYGSSGSPTLMALFDYFSVVAQTGR